MSGLLSALLLGGYSFLILPSILVILVAFLDRSQEPDQPTRRKLLILLSITALVIAFLGLLIWFNPYGRQISSSLPAYGVLIVSVALLTYLCHHWRGLAQLWPADKWFLILFSVIYMALFGLLWLAEHITFYMLVGFTLMMTLAWYAARAKFVILGIVSLLALGMIVTYTGGEVYIPAGNLPVWVNILMMAAFLLSIFLPAGLLFVSLRGSTPINKSRSDLVWSLVLGLVLLAGTTYQIYWDGIWSSAHDRAFEDHLPFAHFLFSMIAGILLTLTLRGFRRWIGPVYILLVTIIATLALSWGWNVSAFEMTESRAATVDKAIVSYQREHNIYPASLAKLTPRYFIFLPPPVVVRTGGWCYQSGGDSYRLGYISGNFSYFESEFKIETYASAGELPDGWACDELLAKFQAGELNY